MPKHRQYPTAARRQTEWISGSTNFRDHTAAESTNFINFTQTTLRDFVPCTIIRTVGVMYHAADLNFITNQIYIGAVGGCVVRQEALTSGITAMPLPFGGAGDDIWFWHQFFAATYDDRADSDLRVSEHFVIDSKGSRKVVCVKLIKFVDSAAV